MLRRDERMQRAVSEITGSLDREVGIRVCRKNGEKHRDEGGAKASMWTRGFQITPNRNPKPASAMIAPLALTATRPQGQRTR